MELKLNIYDEQENVVKTYTRQSFSIKMGLLKDVIDTLQLDHVLSAWNNNTREGNIELVKIVANIVMNSYDLVQDLMKKVFVGLTDEEYENTQLNEIILNVKNIILFSLATIQQGSSNTKN